MNVTPMQRTILEYAMTISGEDAQLCLKDPQAFGQQVREQLLAHMPGAALAENAGARGLAARTEKRSKPKPAHRRARSAKKAAGAGSGKTPAPSQSRPKSTAGQFQCPAPGCPAVYKHHARLATHMAKTHPELPIPPKP